MLLKSSLAAAAIMLVSAVAYAQLKPYKDYQVSESVWSVTTIKIDPNMDDTYLEGIKKTWVASNEIQKKLGHIEDYKIYRSDLPQSGDFNLMLIVKYKKSADLGPSKEKYDAFIKEQGEAKNKEVTEFSQKNYPGMRKITGQYQLREITLK